MSDLRSRLGRLAPDVDPERALDEVRRQVRRADRRAQAVLAAAVVVVLSLVAGGVYVLVDDGDQSVRVTTGPSEESGAPEFAEGIPSLQGVAVVEGDELVYVDQIGRQVARSAIPEIDWNHPERPLLVDPLDGFSVEGQWRPPEVDGLPDGCRQPYAVGEVVAVLCGPLGDEREIRLRQGDGEYRMLIGPPQDLGHWRWAVPSASGNWVTAQWSGECEVPVAYRIATFEDWSRPVTKDLAGDPAATLALGWSSGTRRGAGLLGVAGGFDCGGPLLEPGVRFLNTDNVGQLLYPGERLTAIGWASTRQPLATEDSVAPAVNRDDAQEIALEAIGSEVDRTEVKLSSWGDYRFEVGAEPRIDSSADPTPSAATVWVVAARVGEHSEVVVVDAVTGAVVDHDRSQPEVLPWWWGLRDLSQPQHCDPDESATQTERPTPTRLRESRTNRTAGVSLEPVPATATAEISGEEALERLWIEDLMSGVGEWQLVLASYSAETPADLVTGPWYQDRLAWVLIGDRVASPGGFGGSRPDADTPPDPPGMSCYLGYFITGIDANTGEEFATMTGG
jgi:hypothetical protein